jgi:hypothetical protein
MRAASREKNQTPECPSGALTYVRQFVSGNCEIHGRGGSDFARNPRKRNGVMPTHADPSNDSTRSDRGTCLCTTSTGYRQCKNVRSHQLCNMTTLFSGSGVMSNGFMRTRGRLLATHTSGKHLCHDEPDDPDGSDGRNQCTND